MKCYDYRVSLVPGTKRMLPRQLCKSHVDFGPGQSKFEMIQMGVTDSIEAALHRENKNMNGQLDSQSHIDQLFHKLPSSRFER